MVTRRWARISRVVFLLFVSVCITANLCFLLSNVFHRHEWSYQIFRFGDFLTYFWIVNPIPLMVSVLGLICSIMDHKHSEHRELQRRYRRQLLTHLIASPLIWLLSGIALVAFTGGV